MPVELITTQGSRAGTAATIHPGYYLVGRHKECQIRPKSKSVSRRHCLLLHNDDGFGAMDLKSSSGTWINGSRLHPHEWRVLRDGDQIRFGKVAFTVSIKNHSFAGVVNTAEATAGVSIGSESGIADPPESWQSQEIAEFLELEDQAEFEKRYGLSEGDLQADTANAGASTGDDEFDVLADSELADGETGSRKTGDTIIGDIENDDPEEDTAAERMVEVDSTPKKRPPKRQIDHASYKKGPKRSISLPSFSFSFNTGDGPDWKLIGTIFLITLSVGMLAYQVYSFTAGPNFEVRQGLD